MLDHHRARPQGLRRFREEAGENAILKTLDVDLQRIDRALAGSSRMRRIAGLEESRNLVVGQ
jgi:hypothetical protein